MEDNAQNNQIMDSWEEGTGDKSSNISSALDIIEFILSTDAQEGTVGGNEISTGSTKLSTTIYRPEYKATEAGKEDSGSVNKNRQSWTPYERATETKNRNVNQEIIQGGDRRRSGPDSGIETMVPGGIPRSSSDLNNGTQIQEDPDYNEIRKMDKDTSEKKVRQSENVPVEIPRSDAVPSTESNGNSDDGRSLESLSTPNPRHTGIVTTATLDDEEELLMKNKKPRKYQLTPQRDDKEIKKGGLEDRSRQPHNHQHWTKDSPSENRRRTRQFPKPARMQENQQSHRMEIGERGSHPGTSATTRATIEPNRQPRAPTSQHRDRTTQRDQTDQLSSHGSRHRRQMERKKRTQKRALDLQKGRLHYYRVLV
nr:W protein [Respirovirus bovis]